MGNWALGIGHWALGIGHWALGIGSWALGIYNYSRFLITNHQSPTTNHPFPIPHSPCPNPISVLQEQLWKRWNQRFCLKSNRRFLHKALLESLHWVENCCKSPRWRSRCRRRRLTFPQLRSPAKTNRCQFSSQWRCKELKKGAGFSRSIFGWGGAIRGRRFCSLRVFVERLLWC